VRELTTAIRTFINGWNDRAHPFVWTKTADSILEKANRQQTSNTDHKDNEKLLSTDDHTRCPPHQSDNRSVAITVQRLLLRGR
jgi:hypothetical protein